MITKFIIKKLFPFNPIRPYNIMYATAALKDNGEPILSDYWTMACQYDNEYRAEYAITTFPEGHYQIEKLFIVGELVDPDFVPKQIENK